MTSRTSMTLSMVTTSVGVATNDSYGAGAKGSLRLHRLSRLR